MNKIVVTGLIILMAAMVAVWGCKKADTSKPIGEVKAEAEKMDVAQLRDMAAKYKDAIAAKMKNIEDEGIKLKDIPTAELVGEKANQIRANIDAFKKDIDALKERLEVFLDELKKRGEDITGLKV